MKIFVCICTRDRVSSLRMLLGALGRADLRPSAGAVEIIVVDNHPIGAVVALCTELQPSLPVPIHVVEEPRQGLAAARNRAVGEALARGADAIAFIDDDDEPRPRQLTPFKKCAAIWASCMHIAVAIMVTTDLVAHPLQWTNALQ